MTKGDRRFYRRLETTVAQREVGTFRDEERRSVLRPSLPRVVQGPDFSVVLFRPNFMLASEEHLMKVHKNQWLSTMPSPPDLPYGATNQGLHHGVRGADAFAVT